MLHVPGSRTLRGWFEGAVLRRLDDAVRRRRFAAKVREDEQAVAAYGPDSWQKRRDEARVDGPLSPSQWRALRARLSERGRHFFSDNLVSNESSFTDVAASLSGVPHRLAYIGVGPEQIFSHVAWLEPALAFVVDVRADNALLHRLYQAMFAEARDRLEWLGLLLGRDATGTQRPPSEAPAAAVLDPLAHARPSVALFERHHRRLLGRVEALGGSLSTWERHRLHERHERFFRDQLELRFRLRGPSPGTHPPLGQLLAERSRDGLHGSFLASEQSYQIVRRCQQELRIVPVVGDLAGDHTLPGIAEELRARCLPLGVVYSSNVEQYLMEHGRLDRWVANLVRLPHLEGSLVLRAYLDQGTAHPLQRPGHRTTLTTQPVAELVRHAREGRYRTWWSLATAGAREGTSRAPAAEQRSRHTG